MANLSKSMAMIKRSNRAQRQPHHFKVTLLEVSSPRESSRGDITVYPAAHDCQHLARKEKVYMKHLDFDDTQRRIMCFCIG